MASILLIEDDEMVGATIETMLTSVAHSVTVAENGRQGLGLVRTRAFDLVITDIIMPEKGGIETIIELRESHPSLPIIAISGGGRARIGRDFLEIARRFGATRTLHKPFNRKELLAVLAECLAPGAATGADSALPGPRSADKG